MATDEFEIPTLQRHIERGLNRMAGRLDAWFLRLGDALSRFLRRVANLIDDSARTH
jgi:hypothetical protein